MEALSSAKKFSSFMTHAFEAKYVEYVKKLKKDSPGILVVGDTGTGKSSLINIVFGFTTNSAEGAYVRAGGAPVTQEFNQYGPTDVAPVRIIDGKGIERKTVREQMDDIQEYIEEQARDGDQNNQIHLVYYFAGERFQISDIDIIDELKKQCGVIVVLNKCDVRSDEWVKNMEQEIRNNFNEIPIAKCGDPRGTNNWIPLHCTNNKCPSSTFEPDVDYPNKTWRCSAVIDACISHTSGDWETIYCPGEGNDQPFGHKELVKMSHDLLPILCRRSFLTAQRIDLKRKHLIAAGIILLSTGTACGIGAAPIPFSDIAPLLALEAGMAASLAATYGVEMEKIGLSQVAGINTTLLGIGASFGYLTAQMLKCIPVLYLAGAAIDVTIAGTTVCTLGIALSAVLTKILTVQDRGEALEIDVQESVEKVSGTLKLTGLIQNVMNGNPADNETNVSALIASSAKNLN